MSALPPLRWLVPMVLLATGCRPGGIDEDEAERIVLNRVDDYPCSLEFVSQDITLASDVEGTTPDPGTWVSRIPEGGFATAVPRGGAIAIWSEQGEFIGTLGRLGEGPGELGTAAVPIVDRAGTVHVFDPLGSRWSRFSLDGEFLGSTTSPLLGHVSYARASALVGPSTVLISQPSPLAVTTSQFRVLEADGSVTREFGDVPTGRPPTQLGRSIAFMGGSSFWAAPRNGDSEYVLEEWSLDGHLLRTIRREVDWLPTGQADVPRFLVEGGAEGRLIVLVITDTPALTPAPDGAAELQGACF